MSVLLGIDLGDRRIGVAVADTDSGRISPLATISRSTPEHDAETLARLCDEHDASELVVGLPLHLDGSEGEQATRTRDWVDAIGALVDRPIGLRDERRSSEAAQRRLGRPSRGRSGGPPSARARRDRRARVDREAAAVILQAELDARTMAGAGT